MAESVLVNEQSAAFYSTVLKDETGAPVPLAALGALTLTLYDSKTGTIINGRSDQDVLNINGGTFHATSGQFTMTFTDLDNAIVTASEVEEHHVAAFTATWTGGGQGLRWIVDLWVRNLALAPVVAPDLSAAALLSLPEARAALKLTGADQNAELAALVNAVSARWEVETGRRLKARTYTDEYVYVSPWRVKGLGWLDVETPITALTAVAMVAGGTETAETVWMPGDLGTPDQASIFAFAGGDQLFRHNGWAAWTLVKRTYTAGYDPVPADLREAVAATLRHFYYLKDRQSNAVASRSSGAETITYLNTALPAEVLPVIRAYKRWAP